MADTEVLDLEAQENPPVSKEQKPETVTMTRAERDALLRERDEAKQSERYWADRARSGKEPQQQEEDESIEVADLVPQKVTGDKNVDESIFSDPDKWLEAISKGPKAIQTLIRKEGFVTGTEAAEIAEKVARRTVSIERGKITTDNRLMTAFPELADNKSELFRATAEEYQELVAFDESAKKSPATLFAAARAAKQKLEAKAAKTGKARGDEEDEYGYDRVESDRRRRVDAQDGSRSGKGARADDVDDHLGPQARQLAKQMGITDEEMIAEKKKLDAGRRKR